jgi:hypothetical protein
MPSSFPNLASFVSFFPHSLLSLPNTKTTADSGMSLPYYFNAIFNGENFILFTKSITIASMGIAAGHGLAYNTLIMPALAKFDPLNSLAVWCETATASKCNVSILCWLCLFN